MKKLLWSRVISNCVSLRLTCGIFLGSLALAGICAFSKAPSPVSAQSPTPRWTSTSGTATGGIRLHNGTLLSFVWSPNELPRRVMLSDPQTDTRRETASLNYPRNDFRAFLLHDGRVLVVGGTKQIPGVPTPIPEVTPEIFDPATETWSVVQPKLESPLPFDNIWLRSSVNYLYSGKVLVLSQVYNDAYVFDPLTGSTKRVAPPSTAIARNSPTSLLLRSGKVFFMSTYTESSIAESYNPATDTWSTVAVPDFQGYPLSGRLATLLPNGNVLAYFELPTRQMVSAEFAPHTGQWINMQPRYSNPGYNILLPTGEILSFRTNFAEIYNPISKIWRTANAPMQECNGGVLLASGQVFTGREVYGIDFGSNLPQTVVAASAASYHVDALARGSWATAFGSNLTGGATSASAVGILLKDRLGNEYPLGMKSIASPNQVNFFIPEVVPEGEAQLTIIDGGGRAQRGLLSIVGVSPGLFSANANGRGVPAAVAVRVMAAGGQTYEPVAAFSPESNRFEPLPLDVSAGDQQVFLALFGAGWQRRSSLENVVVYVGGIRVEPTYAGSQPDLSGIDQLNIPIPRSLAGRGDVDVLVTVDGKHANPVMVRIK